MNLISLKSKLLFITIAAIILILPDVAFAVPNTAMPLDIMNEFKKDCLTFYSNISHASLKLLWSLVLLEVTWGTTKNIIDGGHDLGKTLTLLIQAIIGPGFYTLFILKGSTWLLDIVDGFRYLATIGTGSTQEFNPIVIFDMGVTLQNQMVAMFNTEIGSGPIAALQNFLPSLLMMAVCLVVLASFAYMALTLFLTTIEAYVLMGIAPILFAMGGARWTKDIALKPWNSMIAIGLKLTILLLIISIMVNMVPLLAKLVSTFEYNYWNPLWWTAFIAGGLGLLSWKIPKLAADALSGTASLSAGDAIQMAAAAAVGAVGAAALGSKALDAVGDKATSGFININDTIHGRYPLDPFGAPGGSNSKMPSMYEPLDHSKGPELPQAAKAKDTGNASSASIGGTNKTDSTGDKPRTSSLDSVKGALDTFARSVPNDQATVGGDLVKNHKD